MWSFVNALHLIQISANSRPVSYVNQMTKRVQVSFVDIKRISILILGLVPRDERRLQVWHGVLFLCTIEVT